MDTLRSLYEREEIGRESISYITDNFRTIIKRPNRNYIFKHDPENVRTWKLVQGNKKASDNDVKKVVYKGKTYYYIKTRAYDYPSALHSAKDKLGEYLECKRGE